MALTPYEQSVANRLDQMPQEFIIGERAAQIYPVETAPSGWRYRWRIDGLGDPKDQPDPYPTPQAAVQAARKEEAERCRIDLSGVRVWIAAQIPDAWFA